MSLNQNLNKAKLQKNDEFYTQLSDIENEMRHYKEHFSGKVVYCNCDDPRKSQFFRYFVRNFEHLKLRKLLAACYMNQDADLFSRHDSERSVWIEYSGEGGRDPDVFSAGALREFEGDGDFTSTESIRLLKQADIVVTNPPFSLFRKYVAQLVEHGKKFLIIGNKNAITYKDIFPLIRENRMWVGHTSMSKDLLFDLPEEIARELKATKKEGSAYKIVDGVVKGRSQSIWFTNLDHKKRRETLPLWRRHADDPGAYPKYDNYDAIEVGMVADIPEDYGGTMGVPISFLDKHNPDQFELLGVAYLWDDSLESHTFYDDYLEMRPDGTKTGMSGKKANGLAVMRGKVSGKNYLVRGSDVMHTKFKRIFIRNKAPLT